MQPPGGFGFAFVNTVGNPNVEHETAETITLGAVLQLADRTSLTVDLYNIYVSDMIASQSQDSVYIQCFSPANKPTFSATHPACRQIVRDPATGDLQPTDVAYTNDGQFETTGVDVQFNWGTDLGPGGLNVSFLATCIDSIKTRVNPQLPWTEWVGTFGPTDLSGVQGRSFDYRTFTTVSYITGDWNLSLRWRHMPEIEAAGSATAAGTDTLPTSSYDIIDLSGGYLFNDDRMTLSVLRRDEGVETTFQQRREESGTRSCGAAWPCTFGALRDSASVRLLATEPVEKRTLARSLL